MAGLLGEGMIGITFGYGIYICEGHETTRVHSHEFRHVYQYEQEGSIANFLSIYLPQIVEYTYNAIRINLRRKALRMSRLRKTIFVKSSVLS